MIAIACGGTGGHLFPGMAVARELARREARVTLLISPKDVDQQAVQSATGFEIVTLPAVAMQSGNRLAFFRGFALSWFAARRYFKDHPPHALIAMGGFTGVPPAIAAKWSCSARIFLHESNTIPGRANRLLAPWVDSAFVGFPGAARRIKSRRTAVTGTPVRQQFLFVNAGECRRSLGFDPARPVILVMGGSQGARALNDLVIASLPILNKVVPRWQWFHLAGSADVEKVRAAYAKAGFDAVVHPFFSQMEIALGAADAAVNRSGASSLAELAAMRVPAVLVPLPSSADNHQYFNARAFEEDGAARLLDQKTATADGLASHLQDLVFDSAVRSRMQSALARWHSPDAAEKIAAAILEGVGCLHCETLDAPLRQGVPAGILEDRRNRRPLRQPVPINELGEAS